MGTDHPIGDAAEDWLRAEADPLVAVIRNAATATADLMVDVMRGPFAVVRDERWQGVDAEADLLRDAWMTFRSAADRIAADAARAFRQSQEAPPDPSTPNPTPNDGDTK